MMMIKNHAADDCHAASSKWPATGKNSAEW